MTPWSTLKLHTHVLFEGRQTSYNIDLERYAMSKTYYLEYNFYRLFPSMEKETTAAWEAAVASAGKIISCQEMPSRCILNIGGEYTIGPVTLGLNIHNLLGTKYDRSGMNTSIIPQQGRWFMGSVTVRLRWFVIQNSVLLKSDIIDEQTGQDLPHKFYTGQNYIISNPAKYQYYRYEVSAVNGAKELILGGFELVYDVWFKEDAGYWPSFLRYIYKGLNRSTW